MKFFAGLITGIVLGLVILASVMWWVGPHGEVYRCTQRMTEYFEAHPDLKKRSDIIYFEEQGFKTEAEAIEWACRLLVKQGQKFE